MDSRPDDPRSAARSLTPRPIPARPIPQRPIPVWNLTAICLTAFLAAALLLSGCAQSAISASTASTASTAAGSTGTHRSIADSAASADSAEPAEPSTPPDSSDSESAYLPSLSARVFGRCWVATADEVGAWRTWRGGEYVPCEEEHTTYTYAAEDLPEPLLEQMRSSPSDAADAALQVRVDDAVQEICASHFADLFPRLTDRQVLVTWFSFLPTAAEVEAGAKWVRCDVGVYAIDASSETMELTALPANVHDLVDASYTSPQDYEYCRQTPASANDQGPETGESKAVTCADAAQWIFDGVRSLGYEEGSPYPGGDAVTQAARDSCWQASRLRGEESLNGWLYYPSAQGWAEGRRTVSCWSRLP